MTEFYIGKLYRVVPPSSDIDEMPCLPSQKAKEKILSIKKGEFITMSGAHIIGNSEFYEFFINSKQENTFLITKATAENFLMTVHMRKGF